MTVTSLPTATPAAPGGGAPSSAAGDRTNRGASSGFGALVAALLGRSGPAGSVAPATPLAESQAAQLGDAVMAEPADADDVTDALLAPANDKAPPPENPMSADRVRWEHIQRVYELCNRNVSETARRLNMHRRTLQRILAKRAPR